MDAASFALTSHWRARSTAEAAFGLLRDVERLPLWWPAYLAAELIEPGDEDGVGRRARLVTRGRLPYRITWIATTTEVIRPCLIALSAEGELSGHGRWALREGQGEVHIRFDWVVELQEGWMRRFAPLLRPVFVWNHHWAMRVGERGLRRELATNPHSRGEGDHPQGGGGASRREPAP